MHYNYDKFKTGKDSLYIIDIGNIMNTVYIMKNWAHEYNEYDVYNNVIIMYNKHSEHSENGMWCAFIIWI